MDKSRIYPCVLLLAVLALVPASALAAGTTLRGVVIGAAQAPLEGVHIAADEAGVSRDTDAKGQFSLTVPPEVEEKGLVRLSFSLRDHQTYSIEVKLPYTGRLQVILSPLFARIFQPILPPDFTSRLRDYRQNEIQRVHTFLGSREKKLLILEGLPSVDAADLLLVSLQDAPAGARKPILWWDCEETDSLALIAEEWARAFRDTNLRNLLQQRQQLQDTPGRQEKDPRDLDREIMAWLLSRLEKSPHIIVLTRFDRWLVPESQQIEDAVLSDFVRRIVNHPQKGKMILVSEEKPVLPRDLNPAWVDGFLVPGLSSSDAIDFLRNHLGLRAGPELVRQAAERLGGRPRALRLLAGSLVDREAEGQNEELRQFLQVGENPLSDAELRPLLEGAYERLSPTEEQVLDLLTVVRQPLAAEEIQEIGAHRTEPLTSEEVWRTARRLARERYWFESVQDAQTGEELFVLAEMARPFLLKRITSDRIWMTELHRRAFIWYQRKSRVSAMKPTELPPIKDVAEYDEFVDQAFSLAEIADGEEKRGAALAGSRVLEISQNWHLMRGSNRRQLSHLKRAVRLLEGQADKVVRHRYANILWFLGNLYYRLDHLAEAEKIHEEALQIYREFEDRLGESNALLSLGDIYAQTARLAEAEKLYGEALSRYQTIDLRLGEANTLESLANLYEQTNRLAEAEKSYVAALSLFRASEDRWGEAKTLWSLGDLYARTDRVTEAEKQFEAALPLCRAIESRMGEANTLLSLGDLYGRINRLAEARKRYEEALPLFRAIENRQGEASTLRSLGALDMRLDRLAEAEARFAEALQMFRAIDRRQGEANTLFSLGELAVYRHLPAKAENQFGEALTIFRAIGDRLGTAYTLWYLGELSVGAHRLAEAEKTFIELLPLFRTIDSRLGEAKTLESLGDLYEQTDRLSEAESMYVQALALFRGIDARIGEANTLSALGSLYVRMNRFSEAESMYEEAVVLFRALESRLGKANTLRDLGRLRAAQNRTEEAESNLQDARSLYLEIDEKDGQIDVSLALSDLYRETNRPVDALREALTAFLIGSAAESPDPKRLLSRLVFLRMKIGQEALDSITRPVIETFPLDARETLEKVLEMMRASLEENPNSDAEAPAEAGSSPSPTSAPDTPPPA